MPLSDHKSVNYRRPPRRKPLVGSCLFGALAALLVTAALLLVFSAVLCGAENPGPFVLPMALFSLYAGALAAGIVSVRRSGDGLAAGLLGGCIFTAAVWLFSCLPLPSSGLPSSAAHILLPLCLPAAALGSVFRHGKPKKPSFRR